jgi:hypothetical protein
VTNVLLRAALSLLAGTLLAGCFTRAFLPERPILECREQQALCRPGSFSEVTLDTSVPGYIAATRTEQRMRIRQVAGLNGPENEFAVAFNAGPALATIRVTSEALHTVRFRSGGSRPRTGAPPARAAPTPSGSPPASPTASRETMISLHR